MLRLKIATISIIISLVILSQVASAATGFCSYYTVASCLREGTSGIMANGRRLKDEEKTCAAWGYKFGTILKVTRTDTKKTVQVTCTDRGPAKRLVKAGRIIDLSYAAMYALNGCQQGIIPVTVEVIK